MYQRVLQLYETCLQPGAKLSPSQYISNLTVFWFIWVWSECPGSLGWSGLCLETDHALGTDSPDTFHIFHPDVTTYS